MYNSLRFSWDSAVVYNARTVVDYASGIWFARTIVRSRTVGVFAYLIGAFASLRGCKTALELDGFFPI